MARRRALRHIGDSIASGHRAIAYKLSRIAISQLMLLSFIMILGSFFFRRMSPFATQWVLYAGIVLFVSSFAIMVVTHSPSHGTQQRWRGRSLEYRTPSLLDRLRHWYREHGFRARR